MFQLNTYSQIVPTLLLEVSCAFDDVAAAHEPVRAGGEADGGVDVLRGALVLQLGQQRTLHRQLQVLLQAEQCVSYTAPHGMDILQGKLMFYPQNS